MKLQAAPRISAGRCAAPAETLARLEAALAPHKVSYTEQAVGTSLYWGSATLDALDFPPMGKGASSQACKISTLAETVEWLALKGRRNLAGYRSGGGGKDSLPIAALLQHIATATPELLGKIGALDLARHWVDGWSLSKECTQAIPLEYVQAISGTNGLAAGNCLEEAIVQGLNEVFERRAAITVIKNRMELPTVDPESIDSAELQAQLADIRALGIEITIKDLSFGGALPCIGVYFVDPAVDVKYQAHHALKVAASFDRKQALSSCLTEYVQLRRMHEASASIHERMESDDATDNFLPLFWFGYVPYVAAQFLQEGDVVPFDPGVKYADCLEDIAHAQEILAQLGMDVLVVDLTDPVIGFPTVQVIVPGYSDILPYHAASSPVLTKGWTRDLPMGYSAGQSVTAEGMFPEW
jgi:ribosomal protein S12 methylthiotransferase accessory factor YcaO